MARRSPDSPARRPLRRGARGDPRARREAMRTLSHSAIVSLLTVVAYFALPLTSVLTTTTVLILGLGLTIIVVLLVWNVRLIVVSPQPRVRAAAALTSVLPLFLVVFAAAYYAMSRTAAGSFSEPLTRVSSAYFTITVFSTVGFGDITPVTNSARIATSVQMLGDVVLVGFGARVILGAAQRGVSRTERPDDASTEEEPP